MSKGKRGRQNSDDDFASIPPIKFMNKGRSGKGEQQTVRSSKNKDKKLQLDSEFSKLTCRICPQILVETIEKLTKTQKDQVHEMGFGNILELKVKDIPLRLGYWLLDNFDALSCEIILQSNRRLHVEPDDVIRVFGMPNGKKEIKRKTKSEHVKLTDEWRAKFDANKKGVTTRDIFHMIVGDELEDIWFKRHLMVLMTASLIECDTTGYVRPLIMSCFEDVTKLREWDWGSYILNRLIESKRRWEKRKGSSFCGPILFLMALYVDRTRLFDISFPRAFPIISNWKIDDLKKRQTDEIETGNFGGGYPLKAIDLPLGYGIFCKATTVLESDNMNKDGTQKDDDVQRFAENFIMKSREFAKMMTELMKIIEEAPKNIVDSNVFKIMQGGTRRLFAPDANLSEPSRAPSSPRPTQFIPCTLDFLNRPNVEAACAEIDKAIADRNALLEKQRDDFPSFSRGLTQESGDGFEHLDSVVCNVAKSVFQDNQNFGTIIQKNEPEVVMEDVVDAPVIVQNNELANVVEDVVRNL